MKYRAVIIAFSFFALNVGIYAQNDSEKSLGIRIGFHSANMELEDNKPDTARSLNGIYLGFVGEKKFAELFYIGTGIEYFQNGLKYTSNIKRKLHTISIPINLKLKIGPAFGLAGAAANFKVSEKYILGDSSFNPLDSDKSSWFDIPVFLGLGVQILFVTVEARYHWGLIEVRNGMHNRYFQLGAALSF